MAHSHSITETVILHLKEGVSFENVADGNGDAAAEAFSQGLGVTKAQPGYIRQYWGYQVEDPHIFVWCIDWQSKDHHTAFVNSATYKSFLGGLGRVFDFTKAAPIQTFTRFASDPTAALTAPATEMAFYTVASDVRDEAEAIIGQTVITDAHPVITVGGSSGGAVGWVFDTMGTGETVPEGQSMAVLGVFGYGSVDDHVKWRQTPEHKSVLARIAQSPLAKLNMGNPDIPGGKIFAPGSCMFHVQFRAE